MISILLPIYNGEKYLKETMESIVNQSFKDFELLIGLNGCTDNSLAIVNEFKDTRIKIFNFPFKNKAQTLNCLLQESTFNFIALQDSDDLWTTDKLEKQILEIEKVDILGTQLVYIDEQSNLINKDVILATTHQDIIKHLHNGSNQVANTSALIKKNALIEAGGWNPLIIGIEDYELWLRLSLMGFIFKNLSTHSLQHRLHSQSNFNAKKNHLSVPKIRDFYIDKPQKSKKFFFL